MDCTFTKDGERYSLGLERTFAHPPEKVWRALTEPELVRQWFPCAIDGEWTVGAPLRFVSPEGQYDELSVADLSGEVLAVEPGRLLAFTWGEFRYRVELESDGEACTLRFHESLPDASGGARSAVGWEFCFENLVQILEGAALAKFVVDAVRARFAHYAAKFEPEFGEQTAMPEGSMDASSGDG